MDEKLSHAVSMALENPISGLPKMAATIYHRDRLVGKGRNERKSHPLQKRFGKNSDSIYLHAEIAAIKDFLKRGSVDDLDGATMFIARVLKNGSPGLAKPCPGCERALVEFGIKEVIWTE